MKSKIFYLLLLLFSFTAAIAQNKTVSGIVTSADGKALSGVTVTLLGTQTAATTDDEGKYTITVPSNGKDVLVFSYIGSESKEVSVGARNNINISLVQTSSTLSDVVVVGYGTQKKENVIGSVTSVNTDEITAAPVSNVSNAIAGRLPGAIFVQTSGEPGRDAASINIRGTSTFGNNQPLVVIDGIPGRDLNSINPEDIQSITILKDASAAIYGSRSGNGVILVTTKGGKNTPATFTYNVYQGLLSPTKLPELTDAATYAQMVRELQSYRGVAESNMLFSKEDVAKYASGEYPWTHPNTNWFDVAMKDYSKTQHHNLSVSGGTENVTYYASFGSQSDDGIYANNSTSYKRYNLKGTINAKINEYLRVGLDITGIQENKLYPTVTSARTWQSIMRMYPTTHAVFPGTDLPGPDLSTGDQPMISASAATGSDNDKVYRSNNLISATLKIPGVKGLNLSGYYAYDMYFRKRKFFEKPWTVYDLNKTAYLAAGNTGKEDGAGFLMPRQVGPPEPRLRNTSESSNSTTANIKLAYDNTFNDVHNVQGFIAYEQNEYNFEGFEAFRRYFVSDQLPYLFAGGNAEKDNNESVNLDARVNYFGRLMYDYNRTYYLQFSLRRDGSLRFPETGRWGTFPSVLVGYRPSELNWWKNNLGFIQDFKLRFSAGKLGNDQVLPFQYLTTFGYNGGYSFGTDRNYTPGVDQANIPNVNITWEEANKYNLGWDALLLNRKLSFEADLFYEKRSNILVKRNASVPLFTGVTLPDENFGIVENRGLEVSLGYKERSRTLQYSVTGNFAFARNKIIEFDEPKTNVAWQTRTGHPMNALLLYKSLGVYSDQEAINKTAHLPQARPGDIIIEDYNGDGKITSDDRRLFALTPTPEITFGLSFDLSYKNWKLGGLVQGQGRALRPIYPDGQNGISIAGTGGNYMQFNAEDRWTPENTDGTTPRAFERVEEYWRFNYVTDYNYADVSFVRLKNVNLSYTIPRQLMQRFRKEANARIYISGQNLALLYSGTKIMDPELVAGPYPIMRVMTFGAQITF